MKKTIFRTFAYSATAVALAGICSCSADTPFDTMDSGEGTLRMAVTVSQSVTRANEEDDRNAQPSTPDNVKIQITKFLDDSKKSSKVTNQYTSIGDIPGTIRLTTGDYAAEAWAGDSLPVSLDKKFYAGYVPFTITSGANTQVSLPCKIRNVVVALDCNSILGDKDLTDYNVKVWHSGGSITFKMGGSKDESDPKNLITTLEEHGYFMMPKDVSILDYEITGTYAGGKFSQTGTLEGVEAAHQYNLKFKYGTPEESTTGGMIQIDVDYDPAEIISNDETMLTMSPTITGLSGFDFSQTFKPEVGKTNSLKLKAICSEDIKELIIIPAETDKGYFGFDKIDLLKDPVTFGIETTFTENIVKTDECTGTYTFKKAYITFTNAFFSRLASDGIERTLTITATDKEQRWISEELKIHIQ